MPTTDNHTRQGDYANVPTGIPFVHGYPVVVDPPPPNTAARLQPRNPAAHPPQPAPSTAARPPPSRTLSAGTPAPPIVRYVVILTPLIYLTFLCLAFSFGIEDPPSFGVEWASVSLDGGDLRHGDSDWAKATWDVELSVQNTNTYRSYKFAEFNVWIMCASGYWSEIVVPPFHQQPKNTTFITATINTSLPIHDPPRLHQGLMLDFQAKFRVRDVRNMTTLATCDNMKVVFPSNSRRAIMVGGRRICRSKAVEFDDF